MESLASLGKKDRQPFQGRFNPRWEENQRRKKNLGVVIGEDIQTVFEKITREKKAH